MTVSGRHNVFAKNELEIAVAPSNPDHIAGLADVTKSGVKLALCAATVPCGAAATKAFAAAKLTPHPVTLEQDVASVLTKVELGEVDAGIVYQTDVKSAGSKVAGVNFAEAASAINTYPIVVVKTGKNPTAGEVFVNYVVSPAGQQILRGGRVPAALSATQTPLAHPSSGAGAVRAVRAGGNRRPLLDAADRRAVDSHALAPTPFVDQQSRRPDGVALVAGDCDRGDGDRDRGRRADCVGVGPT